MVWISVDPGKQGCGVACWMGESLVHGQFVAVGESDLDAPARWHRLAEVCLSVTEQVPDTAIVELMRVYVGGRADPADLLDLQGVAASILTLAASRGATPVGVLASAWKRQVPREVMGARVKAELTRRGWADRLIVPRRATHQNDVLHAIGLGLYALRAGIVTT